MPLSSATSGGLAFVLQLIRDSMEETITAFPRSSIAWEALVISDAYDIPLVCLVLKVIYVTQDEADAFISFALAAANADETLAKESSAKTASAMIYQMPAFASDILKRFAPT